MARTRWPVGPGKPRPLVQAGQIRPAPLVGAVKTWDPADRSSRRTARTASADSEVRPGPRLPTLRPYSVKIGEAGPEALPTLSLPSMRGVSTASSPCTCGTELPVLPGRTPGGVTGRGG